MYKGASRFLQHQINKVKGKPSKSSRNRSETKQIPKVFWEALNSGDWLQGKLRERVKGGFIVIIHDLRTFCPDSEMYPPKRSDDELSKVDKKEVHFQVIDINSEKNSIIVSRKRVIQKQAWNRAKNASENGHILSGIVKHVKEYGAFVDLGGIDGLVHLSEVSDQWIADLSKTLKKGQEVYCTVIGIDEEKKQVSLSMRRFKNQQVKS